MRLQSSCFAALVTVSLAANIDSGLSERRPAVANVQLRPEITASPAIDSQRLDSRQEPALVGTRITLNAGVPDDDNGNDNESPRTRRFPFKPQPTQFFVPIPNKDENKNQGGFFFTVPSKQRGDESFQPGDDGDSKNLPPLLTQPAGKVQTTITTAIVPSRVANQPGATVGYGNGDGQPNGGKSSSEMKGSAGRVAVPCGVMAVAGVVGILLA